MVKKNSVHAGGEKNHNLFNIIINALIPPSSMFSKCLWAPFHDAGSLLN